MSQLTRRRFLEDSLLAAAAAAAAAALPSRLFAEENAPASANEKVTAGIIGCGIRGKQHAKELAKIAGCNIAWVCDPDKDRAAEVAAQIVADGRPAPKTTQDLRHVYDDKSVDAAFICTPNHWHALAAIWAMQAGKDAYVEKPVSHNVAEGRRMVQVAHKLGRICQGGTQYRSSGANAAAVEYMRQGKLGEVKVARSIHYGGRGSIGAPGKCEIPASVDYNLWAGPASIEPPKRPRFHYDWHWVWETGNGELGNNNVHSLDICRWGLGVTGLGRRVLSYGGRFGYTDAGETPNTQVCIFDFGDKSIVTETRGLKSTPYRPDLKGGTIFEGSEGFIAGPALFDNGGNLVKTFEGKSTNHFANFLAAVRSRKREDLKAEILEGHQSSALCHIGNIAWRLGRQVPGEDLFPEVARHELGLASWEALQRMMRHLEEDHKIDLEKNQVTLSPLLEIEPGKESFRENAQANALLTREYRKPFVVPTEAEI